MICAKKNLDKKNLGAVLMRSGIPLRDSILRVLEIANSREALRARVFSSEDGHNQSPIRYMFHTLG